MKKIQSILVLRLVLVSGYARSQCQNLRFSTTSNAWPTVGALVGNPQRICLTQNLPGGGNPADVTIFTSASPALSGTVVWEIIGGAAANGITQGAQTAASCTFRFNTPGAAPFDFGKARVAVKWFNSTCGCLDTLDLFRVMNPQVAGSFAPIVGPSPACIVPGNKLNFFVDPRFTRPANVNLGIGIDGYTWSVVGDNTAGVGDWTLAQDLPAPAGFIRAGDNSSNEIQAPSSLTWTNPSATISVQQGNTCNTTPQTFLVQKGAATATIKATVISSAYDTSNALTWLNGTNSLNACLNAGTGTTPITLRAPAGNTYFWSLPSGYSYASGSATSQTIVVNATGNTSGTIQVSCTPLTGFCGNTSIATLKITRRLTSGNTITMTTPSPSTTCLQPGTYTFTIANFPPDGGTSFNVPVPAGTTNITVGAINTAGQFTVTTTASSTASGLFTFTASPIVTVPAYVCSGNSNPSVNHSIPGIASLTNPGQNFGLTFPSADISSGGSVTYNLVSNVTVWTGTAGVPACGGNALFYDWTYTGGTNVSFPNQDGCTANASRQFSFDRITPAPSNFGGGTLSVTIRSQNASAPVCTTCTNPSCLSITASIPVPLFTHKPPGGGGDPTKRVFVEENIKVYPNPTSGEIFVEGILSSEFNSIELISPDGKVVGLRKMGDSKTSFNIKNLPTGIYLVKISTDRKVINRTIVKK